MKKAFCLILTLALALTLAACGGGTAPGVSGSKETYTELPLWPDSAPDESLIGMVAWELDTAEMLNGYELLSVSPSGEHILAMDLYMIAADVPTMLLYSNKAGVLAEKSRIELTEEQEKAARFARGCAPSDFSWSDNEQKILFSNWRSGIVMFRAQDIILLDFEAEAFVNLTGEPANSQSAESSVVNVLPRWSGNDIYFHRVSGKDKSSALMKLYTKTGTAESVVNLVRGDQIYTVTDSAVYNDAVYYIQYTAKSPLGSLCAAGSGGRRVLLGDVKLDRDTYMQYGGSLRFVQVSPDGRRLCLTTQPLQHPLSLIPGWIDSEAVPHSVFLYDLETDKIVDPFAAEELRPGNAHVSGAAFSPDGKSLLCAVRDLREPGLEAITKLYQIRLDDGSFDAVEVFAFEYSPQPDVLDWADNHCLSIFNSKSLSTSVLMPAAFWQYTGSTGEFTPMPPSVPHATPSNAETPAPAAAEPPSAGGAK